MPSYGNHVAGLDHGSFDSGRDLVPIIMFRVLLPHTVISKWGCILFILSAGVDGATL